MGGDGVGDVSEVASLKMVVELMMLLFVAVVMLATLFGVLRQDSMDVLAKASSSHSFPAALGMAPSLAWDTVYDHDRMAQQAHAETMALLRATDPRFAKNINAQPCDGHDR